MNKVYVYVLLLKFDCLSEYKFSILGFYLLFYFNIVFVSIIDLKVKKLKC